MFDSLIAQTKRARNKLKSNRNRHWLKPWYDPQITTPPSPVSSFFSNPISCVHKIDPFWWPPNWQFWDIHCDHFPIEHIRDNNTRRWHRHCRKWHTGLGGFRSCIHRKCVPLFRDWQTSCKRNKCRRLCVNENVLKNAKTVSNSKSTKEWLPKKNQIPKHRIPVRHDTKHKLPLLLHDRPTDRPTDRAQHTRTYIFRKDVQSQHQAACGTWRGRDDALSWCRWYYKNTRYVLCVDDWWQQLAGGDVNLILFGSCRCGLVVRLHFLTRPTTARPWREFGRIYGRLSSVCKEVAPPWYCS